jgi:hypothetical protein
MGVMVDLYCASYTRPPPAVTLDIDDTVEGPYSNYDCDWVGEGSTNFEALGAIA